MQDINAPAGGHVPAGHVPGPGGSWTVLQAEERQLQSVGDTRSMVMQIDDEVHIFRKKEHIKRIKYYIEERHEVI